jgi:hypothetical protein
MARLFTIVAEFRGTTCVSQVDASVEYEAVNAWAGKLREERPFGRASSCLAKSAEAELASLPPVAIIGVATV